MGVFIFALLELKWLEFDSHQANFAHILETLKAL